MYVHQRHIFHVDNLFPAFRGDGASGIDNSALHIDAPFALQVNSLLGSLGATPTAKPLRPCFSYSTIHLIFPVK
ncbi:hypothetical protein M8494_36045 [Serratia ureilytica]